MRVCPITRIDIISFSAGDVILLLFYFYKTL